MEEQKTVNDTIQMQAKLLKEWQKALREKEQTISALRADVAFLKQVLAQSMEQNGRSVLIRENSSHSAPQFALEERFCVCCKNIAVIFWNILLPHQMF